MSFKLELFINKSVWCQSYAFPALGIFCQLFVGFYIFSANGWMCEVPTLRRHFRTSVVSAILRFEDTPDHTFTLANKPDHVHASWHLCEVDFGSIGFVYHLHNLTLRIDYFYSIPLHISSIKE
jgi:hypothetical protein